MVAGPIRLSSKEVRASQQRDLGSGRVAPGEALPTAFDSFLTLQAYSNDTIDSVKNPFACNSLANVSIRTIAVAVVKNQ